jgi:molybdate/tungstate transport system substrate-binding protein
MLVAGSLADAVENGLRPAAGPEVRAEARGSAAAARLVAEGKRDPDVLSLADVALFSGAVSPPWHAVFATNAVVLAHDPGTPGGRRVERAGPDRWYDPLLAGEVRLGRTDPDLDPLGYRTLFALDLASEHYGTGVDLRAAIPEREQVYPETRLASAFEAGELEAAFLYRSTAVDRGYQFVSLPSAVDLSDPRFADGYADATHTLPGGRTVRGAPIAYGATLRNDRTPAQEVFRRHVTADYLSAFGFEVPGGYPRYAGDPPDWLG